MTRLGTLYWGRHAHVSRRSVAMPWMLSVPLRLRNYKYFAARYTLAHDANFGLHSLRRGMPGVPSSRGCEACRKQRKKVGVNGETVWNPSFADGLRSAIN